MTDRLMDMAEALLSRHYGKYRGTVSDNTDATGRGRLLVRVPAVMGEAELWALPCLPYAGPGVGLFALPPVGANIWVEFEGGNTDFPVWSGCFWADNEAPPGDVDPAIAFFKTDFATLRIDNQAGEILIETSGGARITLSDAEISLEAPKISSTANGATTELTAAGFDALAGALKVV
ncbi:phage baseplate assembly protein V [Roseovarius sp. D22-M7]|uniref:phage baseplate assembly protein V n=1 Tax=Roseovarius sp. D22-M7 TaxID=3127116 RepID=UPI00300FD1E4